MTDWNEIERHVGLSAFHFGKVATIIDAVLGDEYVASMALRHSILCGERELDYALAVLRREHAKGAGLSVLSETVRHAYLRVRALGYEDMSDPSSVDLLTLQDAIAAAGVFAECLKTDLERIKREVSR